MTREEKIEEVKKLCGVDKKLTWAKLCSLTEFDSFATCFSFGFAWNKNCPNDEVEQMKESYLSMIIFNVSQFPKAEKCLANQA